jgi:hypothetical protein
MTSVEYLQELQVRRKFYISVINKQTNAAKALVRRALGQQWTDDEDSRAASSKRAADIVSAAISGAIQKPENAAVASALAADLEVVARGIEGFVAAREVIEKEMERAARSLPIWKAWGEPVRGFGAKGLAIIIAEAGDLSQYPEKGHLWKRFGLAPFGGRAYSTWRMKGELTADDWTEAGYSPRRRAEAFACIAAPLIKARGHYKDVYDLRVVHEYVKAMERGLIPASSAAVTVKDWADKGKPQLLKVARIDPKIHISAAHINARANRYMTKIFLRDLWREWNREKSVFLVPEKAEHPLPTPDTHQREAMQSAPEKADFGVPIADTNRRKAGCSLPEKAMETLPTVDTQKEDRAA